MSYALLEKTIADLFLAEKTLKDNTSLFERYITDQSIPLSKRWDFWLLAPCCVKGNSGWCSDGRLEAFRILDIEPRDAICYDGKYVNVERYETVHMESALESIKETFFDYDGGRDFDKIPEGFDWDSFNFELDSWEEFPVLSEFIIAFKEEVLAKNIESFKYDW